MNLLTSTLALFRKGHVSSVILLLCTSISIFVLPALELSETTLSLILFSIILFIAAASFSTKVLMVGMVAILIEISTRTTDLVYLHYFAELTTNLFLVFLVGSVILDLMRHSSITIYSLIDALNGYFLLGMLFASLVAFCELYIPGSFTSNSDSDVELMYYTFITLTTAGYGDITPNLPIAKSLSMLIAVAGQFYVAIIVAIIVGKYANILGDKTKSSE